MNSDLQAVGRSNFCRRIIWVALLVRWSLHMWSVLSRKPYCYTTLESHYYPFFTTFDVWERAKVVQVRIPKAFKGREIQCGICGDYPNCNFQTRESEKGTSKRKLQHRSAFNIQKRHVRPTDELSTCAFQFQFLSLHTNLTWDRQKRAWTAQK